MKRLLVILLTLTLGLQTQAIFAKNKAAKGAKKNDGAAIRKLLASDQQKLSLRGKNPEFKLRAVILSSEKISDAVYSLKLLPLEILSNPQHYIDEAKFTNGFEMNLKVASKHKKLMNAGNLLEVNQHYEEQALGEGNARLVNILFKQDYMITEAAATAYLQNNQHELQIINALKALKVRAKNDYQDEATKANIEKLASGSNKTISSLAKELL